MVVVEDASHKAASQFKHRSFSYYDQLTSIYAKDRDLATRSWSVRTPISLLKK
ncbi:hypothetical protein Godav_018882 [Gossypium davidsonii]|uniref:Uncharacterized protein n=1 Tax=Gossypium davidsonii TaxID=34287 RepID=A0A7J8QYP4_GOSDV|nr:hypothetical protein [Gossypium davidsonii]